MDNLDSEEQLYLALHAIENGQHDIAISRLKEIEPGPGYTRAQYLLAAEYAQIGLYERAKSGMAYVIDEEPSLTIASLQKGLLHITLGENEQGRDTLSVLTSLGDSDPIKWFACGLIALIDDDKAGAKDLLQTGISLNKDNVALNKDIEKIIGQLDNESADTEKPDGEKNTDEKTVDAKNKFFLSNYNNH